MEAQGPCNWRKPHKYITCKTCISRVGVTRNKQQFYSRTYGTKKNYGKNN